MPAINPPRQVRTVLYLVALFATPTIVWASSTDRVSDPTSVLLSAFVAIISGLAAANSLTDQVNVADVITLVKDGKVTTGGAASLPTGQEVGTVDDPVTGEPVAVAVVQPKLVA